MDSEKLVEQVALLVATTQKQEQQINHIGAAMESLAHTVENQGTNMQDAIASQGQQLQDLFEKQVSIQSKSGTVSFSMLMTVIGALAGWTALVVGGFATYVSITQQPITDRLNSLDKECELRDVITIYKSKFGDL